jgi:hypothetical protein
MARITLFLPYGLEASPSADRARPWFTASNAAGGASFHKEWWMRVGFWRFLRL